MKTKDIDRFFIRKMKFELLGRSNHDDYQVRLHGGAIPIPSLLTLTRGSKEVSIRNVKGLAENLGMSLGGFKKGPQCRISRCCILACLAGRLLEFGMRQAPDASMDPPYDDEMLIRLCESSEMILLESFEEGVSFGKWTADERKEWIRLRDRLQSAYEEFRLSVLGGNEHLRLRAALDRWNQLGT